jgi:hypothetical protein
MPELRQSTGAGAANDAGALCVATFEQPTLPGSLIVCVVAGTHEPGWYPIVGPSGFSLAGYKIEDRLTTAMWYLAGAPSLSQVGVYSTGDDTTQIRVLEYTGAAQSNALDKVQIRADDNSSPATGSTGTTAQADEIVVAAIANRWPSTAQSGFVGGLTKLSETTSPNRWGSNNQNQINDDRRSRLTVHQAFQTTTQSWALSAKLGTGRDWGAIVATFKGGTSGPARFTATSTAPVMVFGGTGSLTVFGPLKSTLAGPVMEFGGSGRIGPFDMQMRLGGWTGLLIGAGTDYWIESVDGLGGADIRVSDSDLARGDGSGRGQDLQSARLIQVKLNFADVALPVLEQLHADLMSALVPQPDTDWDLLFRRPGRPLQIVRVRPVAVPREDDLDYRFLRKQSFTLRAADPRIYSARERIVPVAVTPAGATAVTAVSAVNIGNGRAYPLIQIDNRGSVPLTGVQLVNATGDVAFEVNTVIPAGSQLIGDMPAWVTQSGRSVVRLDGNGVYGAWAPPKDPFFLEPAPFAVGGSNAVWLRTTPGGADVACTLTYRDTWAL